jgi:hypothetical protein
MSDGCLRGGGIMVGEEQRSGWRRCQGQARRRSQVVWSGGWVAWGGAWVGGGRRQADNDEI